MLPHPLLPPQKSNNKINQIQSLFPPQPQPSPESPPVPLLHKERIKIIQMRELQQLLSFPHPQFVATRSLIRNLLTIYNVSYEKTKNVLQIFPDKLKNKFISDIMGLTILLGGLGYGN